MMLKRSTEGPQPVRCLVGKASAFWRFAAAADVGARISLSTAFGMIAKSWLAEPR